MKGLVTPSLVSSQWQGGMGYNNPIMPRNKSTVAFAPNEPEFGFVKRMMKRAGWFNTSKTVKFKLSDTFFSWFLVTELHVWMTLVRVMAEGKDGRFTRNVVVEAMWSDTATRAKKLGVGSSYDDASKPSPLRPVNPAGVKEQIHDLSQQFNAALLSYDEGLLGDDRVLAGAIWRRFFQREVDSPQGIERLVSYIRQQVGGMPVICHPVYFPPSPLFPSSFASHALLPSFCQPGNKASTWTMVPIGTTPPTPCGEPILQDYGTNRHHPLVVNLYCRTMVPIVIVTTSSTLHGEPVLQDIWYQ
uniref:Ubiquinol-cytochrome c chaperone domain-containing protein n=1 Tax=Timema genevievae TaxID=629358 RepID=A0A7R9JQY1_TIMGE|nr:unnamed protein product [Timema genevievae]